MRIDVDDDVAALVEVVSRLDQESAELFKRGALWALSRVSGVAEQVLAARVQHPVFVAAVEPEAKAVSGEGSEFFGDPVLGLRIVKRGERQRPRRSGLSITEMAERFASNTEHTESLLEG